MNTNKIEIAPFDNLLVYKKEYTPEVVSRIIKEKQLGGLRIFAVLNEDRLKSLDFLRELTFLERLDITSAIDYDFNFLNQFQNLKKLSINVEGNNEIKLSSLYELQFLSLKWRKNIIGIENCTNLSSLNLTEFNEKNLLKIQGLRKLVELKIKTASIENLSGINNFANLKSLSIGNCRKLKSISAISHLLNIKELYLDKCPNINDYEKVTDLPNLEILSLIDCGKVQSLKFINQYIKLCKLNLLGNTEIVDGDLIPAKRVKSVEHRHYTHYNLKIENTSYNNNVKKNLENLTKWFK